MILRNYSGLYKRGSEETDQRIGQGSIDGRWTWLAMVDRLANGDITKHDAIYARNYIECLNLLSYWHERDEYYKQIQEQQKNSYRR